MKRKIIIIAILFVTQHVFLLVPTTVYADTLAPAEIGVSTTWTADNSPYILNGRLTVDPGATLTIDPGVTIKVNNSQIVVQGNIIAEGTQAQKIYFTSSDGAPGSWGMNVSGGQLLFDNVIYQNASSGISLFSASSTINDSEIYQSSGIVADGGTVQIDNTDLNTVPFPISAFGSSVVSLASTTIEQASVSFPPIFGLVAGGVVSTSSSQVIGGAGLSSGISISDGSIVTCVRCLITPADKASALPENGVTVSDSGAFVMNNSVVKDFPNDGIFVDDGGSISVAGSDIDSNGNGLELMEGALGQIASSTIENNTDFGIISATYIPFNAKNNWWGSDTGPLNSDLNSGGTGNQVSEHVDFTPWIKRGSLTPPCCSSIAFIPGIEASRLYEPDISLPETQKEIRYWEPGISTNTNILDLNPDGTSVKKDIYTRDIIDGGSFLGLKKYDVYAGFENYLNTLVASGTIHAWQSLPYDWRFSADDIARGPVALANNQSYSMLADIEQLATSSKTGKVTIVAHSYGGLVAKELINLLSAKGEAGLVDKLVLVASPQLGTPESVAGMLHGDDQAIGDGVILEAQTARNLGKNMEMAYDLLPSSKYFSSISGPIVTFDPSVSAVNNFRKVYGDTILSATKLNSFLAGSDGRAQPRSSDLQDPAVLSNALLSSGTTLHNTLDSWIAPLGISVYQIAGIGLPTLAGIVYKAEQSCLLGNFLCGSPTLDHQPINTDEGDGTVVVQSATGYPSSAAATFYVNLSAYNTDTHLGGEHQTFLEVPATQDLIANILHGTESSYSSPYVSISLSPSQPILTIGVHSPVSLTLRDASGDRTGLSANQPASSTLEFIDENIPNSYYFEFGEGKYITVSAHGSYEVDLSGQSSGSATLSIDQSINGVSVASTTYSNIPVSTSTEAHLSLVNGSATTPLLLDNNGDGTIDATITPDLPAAAPIAATLPVTASSTVGVWSRLDQFIGAYCSRADKGQLENALAQWQIKMKALKKEDLLSPALVALDKKYTGTVFNSASVKKYIGELFDAFTVSIK